MSMKSLRFSKPVSYTHLDVYKRQIEDARNYFARVGADLIAHFGRLGSKCVELETCLLYTSRCV